MSALRQKPLAVLISEHKTTKINNLPTDMQVLFGFLALIVDIKYHNQYGAAVQDRKKYNKEVGNTL